jgi:transposase-like protein
MANKKKGKYGKRYSEAEKSEIVNAWRSAEGISQVKFVAQKGITTATLNKWLKTTSAEGAKTPGRRRAEPVIVEQEPHIMEQQVVFVEAPRAVATLQPSFESLVQQAMAHRQATEDIKAQLHAMIDSL